MGGGGQEPGLGPQGLRVLASALPVLSGPQEKQCLLVEGRPWGPAAKRVGVGSRGGSSSDL